MVFESGMEKNVRRIYAIGTRYLYFYFLLSKSVIQNVKFVQTTNTWVITNFGIFIKCLNYLSKTIFII